MPTTIISTTILIYIVIGTILIAFSPASPHAHVYMNMHAHAHIYVYICVLETIYDVVRFAVFASARDHSRLAVGWRRDGGEMGVGER